MRPSCQKLAATYLVLAEVFFKKSLFAFIICSKCKNKLEWANPIINWFPLLNMFDWWYFGTVLYGLPVFSYPDHSPISLAPRGKYHIGNRGRTEILILKTFGSGAISRHSHNDNTNTTEIEGRRGGLLGLMYPFIHFTSTKCVLWFDSWCGFLYISSLTLSFCSFFSQPKLSCGKPSG